MNQPIRAVIVDDEPVAREALACLLQADSDVEIAATCADGAAALAAINQQRPDLVFLDVQMPGLTGFDVVRSLTENQTQPLPMVIFVTAYDQYALRAFEVHALDYLLKPFKDERFYEALTRAKQQVRQNRRQDFESRLTKFLEDRPAESPAMRTRLAVKDGSRLFILDPAEVQWCESADHYMVLHTNQDRHIFRGTIRDLLAKLPPESFVQIHRSLIINLNFLRELRHASKDDMEVVLTNGHALPVARGRLKTLKERLGIT